MPFQRRRKCIFHWRGRAWLTIWDRVKILRYSHKLMHRERVTCMTVISARWRSNMPFQRRWKYIFRWPFMGGDWVGGERLYNWVHRKFKQFGDKMRYRKPAPSKGNPQASDLLVWRPDQLEIRCSRENSTQERAGPRASGWASQENGKETRLWPKEFWGVNVLQFCLVSNSLSHTNLSNKVRGIFFWRTVSLVFIIVSLLWFWMHLHMSIQHYSDENTWNHLTMCKQ